MSEKDNIALTKRQSKILKYILKHNNLQSVLTKFNLNYKTLQDSQKYGVPANFLLFSDNNMDAGTKIFLSQDAIDVLQKYRLEWIKTFIPIIISIISLIASFRQELSWLLQQLEQIWK